MKNLLLFIFLTVSLSISAQKISSAVEFNDYVVKLQNEIGEKMIVFNSYLDSDATTKESILKYLEEMLIGTRAVIKRLEKLEAWDKNTELKNSAMELFRYYEQTFNKDYRRMIEIIWNPKGLTEESISEMMSMMEEVTQNEKKFDEGFKNAQNAIAAKYNIKLEDNELQNKIDK